MFNSDNGLDVLATAAVSRRSSQRQDVQTKTEANTAFIVNSLKMSGSIPPCSHEFSWQA